MSGSKWKQTEIISENDLKKSSPWARYMVTNLGYYFYDKKTKKAVTKWEVYNTFSKEELEDIYAGIQVRYERRKK